MGLSQYNDKDYYQGDDLGYYQFTSIDDIINQFIVAYVGENKIIPKVSRVDVSFHAKRALQELSFDTFKSINSQEIVLPPTLVMPLPHDYVNYTRLTWVDSSGIKHPLYHTNDTSNPFKIKQEDNGLYSFPSHEQLLVNRDFSEDLSDSWNILSEGNGMASNYQGHVGIINGVLTWRYVTKNGLGSYNWSHVPLIYQAIDVSDKTFLDISADGVAEAITYNEHPSAGGTTNTTNSTVRFGLSTSIPTNAVKNIYASSNGYPPNPNVQTSIFNLQTNDGTASYLEWQGVESGTKELLSVDVTGHDTVYVIALAIADFPSSQVYGQGVNGNQLDNISITSSDASVMLQSPYGEHKSSTTWGSYQSVTPAENNNDDYEDDTYWPLDGSRYGLDPQHSQVNGSFYIDNRIGRIHFSSNISGKTVILDYISDSLHSGQPQVHKFAEEAMYKWIAHAIISTSSYGQQLAPRFKKEKFAAIRQAKLRLSNIKLEEITQILRGKSKQIKH